MVVRFVSIDVLYLCVAVADVYAPFLSLSLSQQFSVPFCGVVSIDEM